MGSGKATSGLSGNQKTVNQAPISSNVLSRPVPILYGLRDLSGTVAARTNLRVTGDTGSGKGGGPGGALPVIQRTLDIILCGKLDELTQIRYYNKVIWTGSLTPAMAATESSDTIGRGGVVVKLDYDLGTAAVYFGSEDQDADPILRSFLPDTPYHRGKAHVVLHGGRNSDHGFKMGNSDRMGEIQFRCKTIPPAPPGVTWDTGAGRVDAESGLAADFAVAANVDDFAPVGEARKNRRYRITIYGTASTTEAVIDVADVQQPDVVVTGATVQNGVAFDLGSFGATATLSWTGALGEDGTIYQWDVFIRAGGDLAGGANAAYIWWDLLTNPANGALLPDAVRNPAAFVALAPSLATTGLSFALDEQRKVGELLEDMLHDMFGALAFTDGVITPRLFRTGAVAQTLQSDDLMKASRHHGSWYELPRHLRVVYPALKRLFRDTPLTLAGAGEQTNDDKLKSLEFKRVTLESVARVVGTWRRTYESLPAHPDTVRCRRVAFRLQAGDYVLINAPAEDFDGAEKLVIIEVREMADDSVEFDVLPDVVSDLPTSGDILVTGGSDDTPAPVEPIRSVSLQQAVEGMHLFYGASKRATLFALRVEPDVVGFHLVASLDGVDYDEVLGTAVFHAGGTLTGFTAPRYTMDRRAKIRFTSESDDIGNFFSLSDSDWFARKMLVFVGAGAYPTLFSARELQFLGDKRWELRGLYGPLGDTRIAAFPADVPVWVFRIQPLYSVLAEPAWVRGTQIYFKAIPYGSRQSPALSEATAATLTISDRARLPLAPENLLANNRGGNSVPVYSTDILLTFALRSRNLDQLWPESLLPTGTAEIDTCEVEIWVADALVRTETVTVKHTAETTAVTSAASESVFDVAGVGALAPGYFVGIVHAGIEYFRRVQSLAGSTVTLFRKLAFVPDVDDVVHCYENVSFVYTQAMNEADNGALADEVELRVYSILNTLRSLNYSSITVIKQ